MKKKLDNDGLPRCKKCGDGTCVCDGGVEGMWFAHCMTCSSWTKICKTKTEAREEWTKMNSKKTAKKPVEPKKAEKLDFTAKLPFPMSININAYCLVKLTAYGAKILREYEDAIPGIHLPSPHWDKKAKTFKAPLWELMHAFGPGMCMGNNDMPFENNVIEFLEGAN